MSLVTTVDLLRHGESEGGDIFRGATDVPLMESGWQQMHGAVENIDGWQKIISSPMLRCHEFASDLAHRRDIPITINQDLREIFFGDWEGRQFSEIQDQQQSRFNAFWEDPFKNTPPAGEPMLDFCYRVDKALWLEIESQKGQHLLLVVHGGVIRAVLYALLHSEPSALMRYDVPYACMTRIKIYHDEDNEKNWPQLVFHNR